MSESLLGTMNVAITGAAGQIGYSLIPDILDRGGAFSRHAINLRLLEVPPAMGKLEGIAMETQDMAYAHLNKLDITDNPHTAFDSVDFVFMVGARPRGPGMDRADLLEANAPIFVEQGKALNDVAADGVRALIVGNPANANALVALSNAPDISPDQFSAMSRLDHNRAVGMLAAKLSIMPATIHDMVIWGNHSDTMVTDIRFVRTDYDKGKWLIDTLEPEWVAAFSEKVAKRGSEVIQARGASSAMSAARAAADQAKTWLRGSYGDFQSMALYSHGENGIPHGVVSSMPVKVRQNGEVVRFEIPTADIRPALERTIKELEDERSKLRQLGMLAVER